MHKGKGMGMISNDLCINGNLGVKINFFFSHIQLPKLNLINPTDNNSVITYYLLSYTIKVDIGPWSRFQINCSLFRCMSHIKPFNFFKIQI